MVAVIPIQPIDINQRHLRSRMHCRTTQGGYQSFILYQASKKKRSNQTSHYKPLLRFLGRADNEYCPQETRGAQEKPGWTSCCPPGPNSSSIYASQSDPQETGPTISHAQYNRARIMRSRGPQRRPVSRQQRGHREGLVR